MWTMFENEEKQLREIRSELEQISIPEAALDDAIKKGFQGAASSFKRKRQKRRKSLWSIVIVAILLLTFATSIRMSPAFANAVASIPGMEKFVEMMQDDKGIEGIVANDYYQPIHASQTKDNLTLAINGVILDETGIVMSYTLEGPFPIQGIDYESIDILHNGERIESHSYSYNDPEQRHENRKVDILKYYFLEKETFNSQDFVLEIQLRNKEKTHFSIPFTLPDKVKEGRVYTLNKAIEIENQKLTIQDVTIYPLRVEVRLALAETNTMKMFHFEDMRIEDEKGEVWSRIQSGSIGDNLGESNPIIYLQSNYFEQPRKLYLKFNEIQALEKSEAFLLVDVHEQEVLKQPSVGELKVMSMDTNHIEIRFPVQEEEHFGYFLFSNIENADGEDINSSEQSMWNGDGFEYNRISLEGLNLKNPLKVNLWAYPNYIKKAVSVEIK